MKNPINHFVIAHGANALSIGVQLVMVAWLATAVLHLSPAQIGWVQAAVLAPNVLLLPFAGAISDRFHPAWILVCSNLALVGIHFFAGLAVSLHYFDFAGLITYGFALGCCNSFIQTGREKLISLLVIHSLHERISIAGVTQQLAQALGILLAATADLVGWDKLIYFQAFSCFTALIFYRGLIHETMTHALEPMRLPNAMREGFNQVWRHVAVRHTIMVVAFNGMMHMGMMLVILPVLAHKTMQFSAMQFSLLQLCFALGGIFMQAVILRRNTMKYPGQAVLFCLFYAGLISLALSYGPTVAGLYTLIFLWGCVSGASANLGRLVVQSVVAVQYRGRVMGIYQWAFFGSAPIGALIAGWIVHDYGANTALKVIAYSSALVFFASFLTRPLWQVGLHKEDKEQSQNGSESQ